MTTKTHVIALAALLATACSSSTPTSPGSTVAATGVKQEAFSVADQPPVGNDYSCQPDAPPEFILTVEGSNVIRSEWRRQRNAVRWQIEIRDHDGAQRIHEEHTADVVSTYVWTAKLADRAYDVRVRNANPGCTPGKWTDWKTASFDPVKVAPPVNSSSGSVWWWEAAKTHDEKDCPWEG